MEELKYPKLTTKDAYKEISKKKELYIHKPVEYKYSDPITTPEESIAWFLQQNNNASKWEESGKPLILLPQQAFLKNLVNPTTSVEKILVFHEPGVGKTCSAIQIAEAFRPYAIANKSNILIVSPSGAKDEFIKSLSGPCTNFKWITPEQLIEIQKLSKINTSKSREKIEKIEKSIEKSMSDSKNGGVYKFITYQGLSSMVTNDPIDMSNGLIIVDEAHNIEDNEIGKSLQKLLDDSENVRLCLLTATPMRHGPEEIVEILNFLVPPSERASISSIFDKQTIESLDVERVVYVPNSDAETIIKKLAKGHVSFLRSYNPYLFPKKISMGTTLNSITCPTVKVVKVAMSELQYQTIISNISNIVHFQSKKQMSNMVFPATPSSSSKGFFTSHDLEQYYKAPPEWLKEKGIKVIRDKDFGISFKGPFLQQPELKKYSPKFSRLIDDLDQTIMKAPWLNKEKLFPSFLDNDNLGKSLIYIEDIKGIGLNLLSNIFQENGFIKTTDATEEGNLNTKCFRCGFTKKLHEEKLEKTCGKFGPARFIIVSGQHGTIEQRVKNLAIFNRPQNFDGSEIKFIIGSKVIQESINLKDVTSVFIMNYQFDFATLVQIIGRAVRTNSHEHIENLDKREVKIYKYVSSYPSWKEIKNLALPTPPKTLSPEEEEYCIGESIHHRIKLIERWLKEIAIDCSLNRSVNIQPEEINKNKNCISVLKFIEDNSNTTTNPTNKSKDRQQSSQEIAKKLEEIKLCPEECDYQDCNYSCFQSFPQQELKIEDLDITTDYYQTEEKNTFIPYIIAAFKETPVWDINVLLEEVMSKIPKRFKLFNETSFYQALQHLITDRIVFARTPLLNGFIVEKGKFLVFQPESSDINVPLALRYVPAREINNKGATELDNLAITKGPKNINTENLSNMKELTISALRAETQEQASYYLARLDPTLALRLLRRAIETLNNPSVSKEKQTSMKKIINYFAPIIIYHNSLPVGFKLGKSPAICYKKNTWVKCMSSNVHPIYLNVKENPEIIGYLEETSGSEKHFKIRPGITENIKNIDDKRKIHRGIVCKTMKRKQLETVLKQYVPEYNTKDISGLTARFICYTIELALRKREHESREKSMQMYKSLAKANKNKKTMTNTDTNTNTNTDTTTDTNTTSDSSPNTSIPKINRWFLDYFDNKNK